MDILKAFNLLDTENSINIQGTFENPLFQANQIGKMLGISNMHHSLIDFSDNEKVSLITSTIGGNQETIFLTELGLYRLFGRSRKQITTKFQEWVPSVLKKIRINGVYNLSQDDNKNKENVINMDKQIKITELNLELKKMKIEKLNLELEIMKIQELNLELERKKIELELKKSNHATEMLPTTAEPNYIKKRNNGITVPKVYQYNPTDLKTPIKIFDSPAEVERTMANISTPALKRASINNTIYKDYRWKYVNRTEQPPDQLDETVPIKQKLSEIRYIAMIDIKKTKILAVYSSQKDAVEARNMKCNSFTRAIQQQHISSGHYWNFFDNCSKEMQEEYLKTNKLPEKYVTNSGIKIQKIDPITKTVISTYNSKRDIVRKYQISYAKLNNLINNNLEEIYCGFIWKMT
jgi:prophage antirepressor-like protein